MRRFALLLLPILPACGCGAPAAPALRPEAAALHRALDLALDATVEQRSGRDYRLIGAQMLLDRAQVWRVTFKPESLLPHDPETGIIGAGGELFVNVDLAAATATVGYGE